MNIFTRPIAKVVAEIMVHSQAVSCLIQVGEELWIGSHDKTIAVFSLDLPLQRATRYF